MDDRVVYLACEALPESEIRVRLPDGPGPYEVDCPYCEQTVVLADTVSVRSDAHQVA